MGVRGSVSSGGYYAVHIFYQITSHFFCIILGRAGLHNSPHPSDNEGLYLFIYYCMYLFYYRSPPPLLEGSALWGGGERAEVPLLPMLGIVRGAYWTFNKLPRGPLAPPAAGGQAERGGGEGVVRQGCRGKCPNPRRRKEGV